MNSVRFAGVYTLNLQGPNQTKLSGEDEVKALLYLPKLPNEKVVTLKQGQRLLVTNDDKGADLKDYNEKQQKVSNTVFQGGRLDPGGIRSVINGFSVTVEFVLNAVTLAKPRQKRAQNKLENALLAKATPMTVTVNKTDDGEYNFQRSSGGGSCCKH